MNKKISIINRICLPNTCKQVDVDDVCEAISSGVLSGYDFKQETINIQAEQDHNKQNDMKKNSLMVALFNGEFSKKNNSSLTSYSSFTALDIDNIASEDDMEVLFQHLCSIPYVYFLFRTPSGKGLKAVILHDNTDSAFHGELYDQLINAFSLPNMDQSVKDLSRGNYICYDPKAWKNPNPVPFRFIHNQFYSVPVNKSPTSQSSGYMGLKQLELTLSSKPRPKSNKSDQSLINIINSHNAKVNPNRTKSGNRANSVFNEATQYCKAGVDINLALKKLIEVYGQYGAELQDTEIEYQACRGYQNNINLYGSTRGSFDKYGSKRKGTSSFGSSFPQYRITLTNEDE